MGLAVPATYGGKVGAFNTLPACNGQTDRHAPTTKSHSIVAERYKKLFKHEVYGRSIEGRVLK